MKGFFLSKGVLPLCLISAVGIDTLILHSFCAAFTAQGAVSPEWDWAAASPESQGMITSQLESVWTDLAGRRTTAFLLIRNDKIVFERFATGHNGTAKHYTASGGSFTPRATARVGRLMLRKGNWEGEQLIARSAVEQITADAGTPGNGAIGWWSNNDASSERLPKDAFWGAGAGHQVLLVVPSLRLIAVRNGESLSSATNFDAALREYFFHPLMNAVNHSPDADSAYEPGDRMVLARVPIDRIRHRQSYEFFQRLDAARQPIWARDINERGTVFRHAGKSYRSSISYNAGLRRYLWCQTLPGATPGFGEVSASTTRPNRGARGPPSFTPKSGTSAPARAAAFRQNG